MLKKKISIIFVISMLFYAFIVLVQKNKTFYVKKVISPVEFDLGEKSIKYSEYDCFDSKFTQKNTEMAKKLKITKIEAFILGNLGQYYSEKLLLGQKVYINNGDDLVYLNQGYKDKFYYSGYCFKDFKPCYPEQYNRFLEEIRKTKYVVVDTDNYLTYEINDKNVANLKNFIVIKKHHLPKSLIIKPNILQNYEPSVMKKGSLKIYFADSTIKIKPDRECSSDICHEILQNINKAEKTIDMAIYGYSRVPAIEKAISNALARGVKIRLVYDTDSNGKNIYPDTKVLTNIIKNNKSDFNSLESKKIMHNKFYIFDDKILITGSANLSHTDMSGFNSNSIIVIDSEVIASVYKKEFEQMFNGKFHNEKNMLGPKVFNINGTVLSVYFSPKDKSITNSILPLIKEAKRYIYIPTFVLTEKRVTDELIKAKNRGVDVKILMDALNASVQHSKLQELRNGGILVKTENYAGKMHSKSMIIDDEYTIIGSMNFSNSGENYNDENLVVIKSSEISKFYRSFFAHQWQMVNEKWLKYNARAESIDSIGSCSDGIDNDYDGLTDLDDPACKL